MMILAIAGGIILAVAVIAGRRALGVIALALAALWFIAPGHHGDMSPGLAVAIVLGLLVVGGISRHRLAQQRAAAKAQADEAAKQADADRLAIAVAAALAAAGVSQGGQP